MQAIQTQTVAVATSDMTSVSDHLARSSAFIVFEIVEGRVASTSVRERGTDACGAHRSFVQMLEGCSAVLCGGIGQGAADSLSGNGILPVVLAARCTVQEALAGYLAGTLETTGARVCLCG